MKILLVATRPPWPPWRGDQLRLRQWIDALAPAHELSLLSLSYEPNAPPLPDSVRTIPWPGTPWPLRAPRILKSLLVGEPAQVALYRSRRLEALVRREAPRHDRVVVLLARLAPLLRVLPPESVILDLIDCLSVSFARRGRFGPAWQRPLWNLEVRQLARTERNALSAAARGVVVSPRDRSALRELAPTTPIEVVPVASPYPSGDTAVDRAPARIAFSGNLGYWVNRDAVLWFGREVWPELRRRRPDLEWEVIGSRPPSFLVRFLKRRGARLLESPADLRTELAACTLALAPLRGGAGQPLKVMDAWAAETPMVVSPWTAEGLRGSGGVAIADRPEEWLVTIERLLDSPAERASLAAAGTKRLARELSPLVIHEALRSVVEA